MSVVVGYVQYAPAYGQVQDNLAAIRRLVGSVGSVDLLVLPELAVSGYDFADVEDLMAVAEPFGEGPTAILLRELSATHGTTLVAGYAERADDRCYNAAMLVTPDGTLHNYRKLHLFSRETLFFTPGDAPPPVIDTPAGRVGVMVCFDWFFPETTRLLALRGAQIVAHPSNLVLPWCQRAMFARSVENRIFTITANRIGTETQAGRTLTFTGGSQILDWRGEVLSLAPEAAEHVGRATIDPGEADRKRLNEFNDLFEDRRIDMYRGLAE